MKVRSTLISILAATTVALASHPTRAADTGSATPAAADTLAEVRTQIAAKNWSGAIAALQRVNESASADWNNLMGYSLRQQATPDLEGAERFYNAALRIEPKHRGALEYSGELYLQKGDLAKAEQRLAALDKACLLGCEQYTDLKKAIERYKAAGNKYLATTY